MPSEYRRRLISMPILALLKSKLENPKGIIDAIKKALENESFLIFKRNNLNPSSLINLFTALKENSTVTHLEILEDDLPDEVLDELICTLKINQSIRALSLYSNSHPTIVEKIAQLLENNQSGLRTLYFKRNSHDHLTRQGNFKALARALAKNHTLTSLSLERNAIKEEDIQEFFIVLNKNITLEKLDLSYNKEEYRKSITTTLNLAQALKNNHQLTYLNLFNTSFNIEILSEALSENHGLIELNIGNNNINGQVLQSLAKALEKNKTLTDLKLSYNQITDEDIPTLIKLIDSESNIIKLDLHGNNLTDSGVELLGTFLKTNKKLKSLDLSKNFINNGINILIDALKRHSTLTELRLKLANKSHIPDISHDTYKAVEAFLTINRTLTILEIDAPAPDTDASQEVYAKIQQAIKRNRELADQEFIEHIQQVTGILPDLSRIIASYAGVSPRLTKLTQPNPRPTLELSISPDENVQIHIPNIKATSPKKSPKNI